MCTVNNYSLGFLPKSLFPRLGALSLSCGTSEHPSGCQWRRRRLSFCSFTALFNFKQLAGKNLNLMSPSFVLGRVTECSCQTARVAQESYRSSLILKVSSYFISSVADGLTAETLPPINSPTKKDQMCLLYWTHFPVQPERSLKKSEFSFFLWKRKGWACTNGWLLEFSDPGSSSKMLPWARGWVWIHGSGSE